MKRFLISTILSILFFLMLSGILFEGNLPEMSLGAGIFIASISIGFGSMFAMAFDDLS